MKKVLFLMFTMLFVTAHATSIQRSYMRAADIQPSDIKKCFDFGPRIKLNYTDLIKEAEEKNECFRTSPIHVAPSNPACEEFVERFNVLSGNLEAEIAHLEKAVAFFKYIGQNLSGPDFGNINIDAGVQKLESELDELLKVQSDLNYAKA